MGQHGKHRPLVRAAACIACLWAAPVDACRLALVLALDVSSSVDDGEDRLQRDGLAAALIAPDVQAAFLSSPDPVAVFVFEWSGRHNQLGLTDWVMIEGPADLLHLSERIAQSTRSNDDFPTAMGYALGHAAVRMRDAPDCRARTIDVSGDGKNNEGFGPQLAYGAFDFAEVTVNGLVITGAGQTPSTELVGYFRDEVIRGPGAFVEVAAGFADYERAMRRKLIREVSAQMVGGTRAVAPPQG